MDVLFIPPWLNQSELSTTSLICAARELNSQMSNKTQKKKTVKLFLDLLKKTLLFELGNMVFRKLVSGVRKKYSQYRLAQDC